MTLDGVMQDPGGFGEIEGGGWANAYFDAEASTYALGVLKRSDYFLCGRNTYDLFKEFWSPIKEGEYAQTMNALPKLVVTTKPVGNLEWNAKALTGDVIQQITELKQQDGKDIIMYGSATLTQSLMQHDLIDEYKVWVFPLTLGHGRKLFTEEINLQLKGVQRFETGVVVLVYQPGSRSAK
jgi:dihydrofolate reductase